MLRLSGAITALVTPFKDGVVDDDAFQRLVERQIAAGVSAVVPGGTTGESATLTHVEHQRLIALCVEVAAGRAAVVAGAGSNATREAVELAASAEESRADAILAVTGYYNKPSQAGLIAHYEALHEATGLPIVLYNVPGRTASDLANETVARLSRLPRVVALKDASGDLARVPLLRAACTPDFALLSGEDMTAVGYNAMGGRGCIGVSSNVAPDRCVAMQAACADGAYAAALAEQDALAPLHDVLFADTNPGPVKYALAELGLCRPDVRAPLAEPPETVRAAVRRVLDGLDPPR
ncbi:MAG: 4-hydroxy-tetrahydrodipicolinate synthase [Pseudomonadota bacterium]